MLKRAKLLFLSAMFLFTANNLEAQYSGGTGTETDPYQLATLNDLLTLSLSDSDWDMFFTLTADIDATETQNWNNGNGFLPIGNFDPFFTGTFDGSNFTISNLYIHRSTTLVGFFHSTNGAIIKNLTLDSFIIEGSAYVGTLVGEAGRYDETEISYVTVINCQVNGGLYIGGLVGSIRAAHVSNCHVSGTISATSGGIAGGLAGQAYSSYGNQSEINDCSTEVQMFGSQRIGGLVGDNKVPITNCKVNISLENTNGNYGSFGGLVGSNLSTIENCYVSGEITINGINRDYIGGLIGTNRSYISNGLIKNCYSNVTIVAPDGDKVGGLAGKNEAFIENCYAIGAVSGNNGVGGLVGHTSDNSQTTNCYATGMVTGENTCGGFVGENGYFATITNCYSSGKVNSEGWFTGGFAGLNRSTANTVNCFFDIETSGETSGIGMNHNGQNQAVGGLTFLDFNNQSTFADAGWSFGNTSQNPWKMGTAPDGYKRPVLFYHNYLVSFIAGEGGNLEPESSLTQLVNCGGNADAIHAIPTEGFYFVEWQNTAGDSICNANPLVVENVISDSTLFALFDIIDGIEEAFDKNVKVYPNPARELVNIEIDKIFKLEKTSIEIQNIYGKEILKIKPKSVFTTIDIKHFKRGVYIVKLCYEDSFTIRKVVFH